MRRREFIAVLGGTAAAWPLAPRVSAAKQPIIGFLGSTTPSAAGPWIAGFVQRLQEHGWVEGRNVALEYQWAKGRPERAAEAAVNLVNLKVDVIVTTGTPVTLAAKQATSVIPIVFIAVADPVASKVVASLARPGGNITGLSNGQTDVAGKRLEILREAVPGLHRLAILANMNNPAAQLDIRDIQAAASKLGLEVIVPEIRQAEDIAAALEGLKGQADALIVDADLLTITNQVRINTLALAARLPTMHAFREFVEAGGLLSYGTNWADLYRRATDFVDKILRGAKPGDLPVEQPTKFDLVVNLTTARALGLIMPPTLLSRADEVVE